MKLTKEQIRNALRAPMRVGIGGDNRLRALERTVNAVYDLFNPPTPMQVTKADVGKICRFPTTLRAEDDVAVFSHKEGDYFVSDANGEYASAKPWYGFQFIPHDGGECPVPGNWRVLVSYEGGVDTFLHNINSNDWADLNGYLPIDKNGQPHEERIRKIVAGELWLT